MPKTEKRINLEVIGKVINIDLTSPHCKRLKRSKPDDIKKFLEKVSAILHDDDVKSFEAALQELYILEVYGRMLKYEYNAEKKLTQTVVYAIALTQPIVEVLFLQHRAEFLNLLALLKTRPKCAEVFLSYLQKTDLEPLAKYWDIYLKLKIRDSISDFEAHAIKIKNEKDVRGERLGDLTDTLHKSLRLCIPAEGTHIPEEKIDAKIERLIEKTKFITTLHQHDSEFAVHRKPERVVAANIGVGILSGAILYPAAISAHYQATGRYTFFSRTKTSELIDDLHLKIDPYRQLI